MDREVVVVLDNVRSAHNVGSIFRTADGAGVHKIILGGYTPAPIDRFGRPQPEIAKTSLGAATTMAWESVCDEVVSETLTGLRDDGFAIVAAEQHPHSTALHNFVAPPKVCYLFGNEIDGDRPELLQLADTILEIPLHGHKESLNVAVTVGIVLYQSA